jgi:hypothetical protein
MIGEDQEMNRLTSRAMMLSAALLCLVTGCGEKASPLAEMAAPAKPKEAATQLERAFAGANAEIKSFSTAASQALQTADYEGAVQSLQMIKERGWVDPRPGTGGAQFDGFAGSQTDQRDERRRCQRQASV